MSFRLAVTELIGPRGKAPPPVLGEYIKEGSGAPRRRSRPLRFTKPGIAEDPPLTQWIIRDFFPVSASVGGSAPRGEGVGSGNSSVIGVWASPLMLRSTGRAMSHEWELSSCPVTWEPASSMQRNTQTPIAASLFHQARKVRQSATDNPLFSKMSGACAGEGSATPCVGSTADSRATRPDPGCSRGVTACGTERGLPHRRFLGSVASSADEMEVPQILMASDRRGLA
jgi:hypothetical protein